MIRKIGILLSALLMLNGCSISETRAPTPLFELKLYVFDCGMLRLESVEPFSIAEDETEIRDLIVPCYVVEHEKGRLLWDGGLASATADSQGWQGEGMLMRLDRTLNEQLAEIGLDMNSFDFMAFSHMHFDHVGVANEVTGATLLIQQAEYDAAFANPVTIPGFNPLLYNKLEGADKVLIEGDYDVFGDGRVRIIFAPGHTAGHQVLFIDLENTGPVVLSGDLYHFTISRQQRRVPQFNVDAQATLLSMDRVEALLEETGAELWIQHELAFFGQLKKSPSSYD